MQFVCCGIVAVVPYLLPEISIVLERTCKLMGITLGGIRQHIVIPFKSLVAVESITCRNTDSCEVWVFGYQLGNSLEMILSTLSPAIEVRFVEWRYCDYIETLALGIKNGSLDDLVPFFRLAVVVILVELFVVAVKDDIAYTAEADMVKACLKGCLLCSRELSLFIHEVAWLERYTSSCHHVLANVVRSASYVVLIIPCHIHTPLDRFLWDKILADIGIGLERNGCCVLYSTGNP